VIIGDKNVPSREKAFRGKRKVLMAYTNILIFYIFCESGALEERENFIG